VFNPIRTIYAWWRMRSDPINYARSLGVSVGTHCRIIELTNSTFGSEPYLITLGNHVNIAAQVQFITHDGAICVFRDRAPDLDLIAPIDVGDNVFIGFRATILPGISIGNGSIVAAGAVVARDVPPAVVVGGVPAKVIKTTAEYWLHVEGRTMRTKGLSAQEKRRVLLGRFHKGGV
jgi:acetyltransferase-like isoleucine patch superfamily enzyme